jgi:hypothetical protein
MARHETRDLIKELIKAGLRVERARSGHWIVYCPDGAKIQIAYSPSDRRSLLNSRTRLRRHGVNIG